MMLIILCKYDRDPRSIRLVIKNGAACPLEVCETDALGLESWRVYKDVPLNVRAEALLARALCESWPSVRQARDVTRAPRIEREDDHVVIDIGTVRP